MHSEVESIQITSEATRTSQLPREKGGGWEEDTNPKNSNDESDRRAELKVKENGCFQKENKAQLDLMRGPVRFSGLADR